MSNIVKQMEDFFRDLSLGHGEQSPVDCRKQQILLGATNNEVFAAYGVINDMFSGIKNTVFFIENYTSNNGNANP